MRRKLSKALALVKVKKCVSLLLAAFMYSFFIFLGSLIIMLPYMKFSLEWGKIIETFSVTLNTYSTVEFSRSIVDNFTPLGAVLACSALNTLAGLFLGLLIYDLNLMFRRGVGSACALILLIFQYVLEEPEGWSHVIMKYLVPVCWMDLTFYHDRAGGGSLVYPFSALLLVCLILFFLGRHLTDRCTFCTQEEF